MPHRWRDPLDPAWHRHHPNRRARATQEPDRTAPAGGRCWPVRRNTGGALLGGVASGLARLIHKDVTLIRVVFLVAGLSGWGLIPYFACWLLIPGDGEGDTILSRAVRDRRTIALAAAVASIAALILVITASLGVGWFTSFGFAYVAGAAALVLVARHGSASERETLRRLTGPLFTSREQESRRRAWLRFGGAVVLLAPGLALLLNGHPHGAAIRQLGGLALILAAIVLVLVPWWSRVAMDLVRERQARARAEERSDIAARLHDSVLQTLALIQRQAGNPQQVVQLARAQERELRSWLFDGTNPTAFHADVTTVAAGVQRLAEEVESRHGVTVDAITVGDAELDKPLAALLEAAREAAVNAAKWSGAATISVFAEVDGGSVSVFVRDRGRGFDPDTVPGDRKGLSDSIRARMLRHGGSARIRTQLGEGTEVALTMPRSAERQAASQS